MGIRNGWKKGEYLIIDPESGMTRFSGQVVEDYTGQMVTKRFADYEQPQDFVKPSDDPAPIPFANPGLQSFDVHTCLPDFVGETSVPTPFGPANHLFICGATAGDLILADNGDFIVTDGGDSLMIG